MTAWTAERKARQSALIRAWKPWEASTGPRTATGKAASARNRQKALERARKEVANARQALTEALARLEELGCKRRRDLTPDIEVADLDLPEVGDILSVEEVEFLSTFTIEFDPDEFGNDPLPPAP
jgi:hypothetical protein